MKKILMLLFLLFAAPVFAAGNMTVFSLPLSPSPVYVNTNQSVNVLNLSLNVTAGVGASGLVNITVINVTINASSEGGSAGNVSAVEIRNATGFPIARNTTVNPANNVTFTIYIPGGFTVNTSNATILIALNISRTATRQVNLSANITGTTEIATNETGNNITISGLSIKSNGVQIQDLHANVTISPRIVDTGVENQTFMYTINITGSDKINKTIISIPAGYTFVKLIAVELGGSNSTDLTTNATSPSQINITTTAADGTSSTLRVYFALNTSSSSVSSIAFTSTITGSNLTNVDADAVLGNQTNVTTMNIINLTTVSIHKGVAIINGTATGVGSDYWEFNLTFNFNETVTGWLQFRMTNWTDRNSNNISLYSCSPSCATLRADVNVSLNTSKINITNVYDPNYGISMSPSKGSLTTLYLRMIIPSGTVISQTWAATYFALFRSTP